VIEHVHVAETLGRNAWR